MHHYAVCQDNAEFQYDVVRALGCCAYAVHIVRHHQVLCRYSTVTSTQYAGTQMCQDDAESSCVKMTLSHMCQEDAESPYCADMLGTTTMLPALYL